MFAVIDVLFPYDEADTFLADLFCLIFFCLSNVFVLNDDFIAYLFK